MTTAPDLIDPFHRALYSKLAEMLEQRIVRLSEGSAAQNDSDTKSVAEKYAAQVSYIRALRDVLEICEGLEQDRYGARKKADED